jgi:hypothetical protein
VEHQSQSSLMYQTVRTSKMYHYFNLDLEEKLLSIMKLTGEIAMVGIRRWRPKMNS